MKKRILFIYGPLGAGGAEKVLIDVLRNFDFAHYEVDLCLMMPGGPLYNDIPHKVHTYHLWSGYNWAYKLAYHVSNKLGVDALLRRKLKCCIPDRYDVVISFLEGVPLKLHALARHLHGLQMTWVHCDLYRFPYEVPQFRTGEEQRAYGRMDRVVCVSHDAEKAFGMRFPECKSKTAVVYNPIDCKNILALSTLQEVKNEKFTIVTVGRLTPPKKLDRAARVARMMKEKGITGFELQIIGEGELHKELERQIEAEGVDDCVKLLGYKKNPYPYIKAADMMFCCSGYEGFCLVICEAMLLGVPVVSTRTSGPVEILEEDKYGLLCNHDDQSMCEAVCRMMNDRELRRHYREVGRGRVENYSVEHTMVELYNLIEHS